MNMSVIQNKNLKNIFNYWSNKITINLTINMEFGDNMKKITLKEMLETEVNDILTNYSSGGHTYFYKNGEGEYHEIVELDLFRGRFITDDGDFSEFEWELEESHIYME